MRKRLTGYPQGFFSTLILTLLVLFASGLVLVPSMFVMRLDFDLAWRIGGVPRLAAAAIHALAGFTTIGLVGALAILHMRSGWRRRRNHYSGIMLLALMVLMVLSAVGIYYAGSENLSQGCSVTHLAAALLACGLFLWHMLRGGGRHAATG